MTLVLPLAEDAVDHSALTGSTQVGEEVPANFLQKMCSMRAMETGSFFHFVFSLDMEMHGEVLQTAVLDIFKLNFLLN